MTVMSLPSFSVVIPTYNRPQALKKCLSALTKLDYPRELYQIVVVDDGSRVSLEDIVSPFQVKNNIQFVRQKNAGPAAARNKGVQHATGELIAFTDDDCMPAADWLTAFAKALVAEPNALVGGRTLNALTDNLYASASQSLVDYLYSYYNSKSQGIFFTSNNIAMSKDCFETMGGFDTAFPLAAAEDRNFCDCWEHAGWPMRYVPEATIRHAHSLTLRTFWKQHFGYGRGAYCYHQIRAKRDRTPIQVEPLSFYTRLLTYPLGRSDVKSPLATSVLFFLSQLATTAGFFWEKQGEKQVA